jgi:tRNA A37 threonylcarbamoyladenosine dehydratase
LQGGDQQTEQERIFECLKKKKHVKETLKTRETQSRYDGLRIVLGQEMINRLANTRLFMVGVGAIVY